MITKTCRVSDKKFEITASDLDFYQKLEIISPKDYQKLKSREITDCVGLPTLCPDERQRRRLTWRNERKLYSRKCNLCKKSIISIYDEKVEFPVYCQDCWWSDKWDAKEFSRDFDFSRPFFEQFEKLQLKVPHLQTINWSSENSVYTNHSCYNKNCYLCINTGYSEDCFYCSNFSIYNKNCVDCFGIQSSELCYFCINVKKSFNSKYLINCESMSDSSFCYDCKSCNNCFGCYDLRHKNFHIFNKPYQKNEYFLEINKIGSMKVERQ